MSGKTPPIITVDNVSKTFALREQDVSLRHEAMTQIRQFFKPHPTVSTATFYALKNVSFSIQTGESVGIIGHNGAGKTTLMRILSRIMRPTSGHVQVNGSYVSLIGLGAGFTNTMSGRRNIYLNAAIHGVKRPEIEEKIDDIIAFADIGQYIDMPVKDYSSGMRARLGFSIAVHILPDIVFLDEVLAVGDGAFQKKSRERLEGLLSQDKTVLMVSHSTDAVLQICKRTLWLHAGEIRMDDHTSDVIEAYNAFIHD